MPVAARKTWRGAEGSRGKLRSSWNGFTGWKRPLRLSPHPLWTTWSGLGHCSGSSAWCPGGISWAPVPVISYPIWYWDPPWLVPDPFLLSQTYCRFPYQLYHSNYTPLTSSCREDPKATGVPVAHFLCSSAKTRLKILTLSPLSHQC